MSEERTKSTERLERTLGFWEALSIGVGTMVGAGIFVFPGIAAGYAGPAAMLSFALAGLIALLVAFSTAELATAMPENGGAYFYVSRIFGKSAGFLVGIGQWIGLIFASAFYLTGFAQYTIDLIEETGYALSDRGVLIALFLGLLLTLINLLGTKGAGKLQNRVVLILSAILTILFSYGILDALGWIGDQNLPGAFFPKGYMAIFTTTALIFTSYLGFVQIATVAGEIRQPSKNLPRALIGSVVLVMGLYITSLFVSTAVLPVSTLADLGETAMVEVARSLVGRLGAMGILAAGLLATLSSANASILSSSRAVFALSKDELLPSWISKVNRRFGTPHWAILTVGIPIALITLLGRIEILAEVASLFHLIMYGMICLTLIKVKKTDPRWYLPRFKLPGKYLLPLLGALFSFSLIFLMEPMSMYIGFGILAIAFLWDYLFIPQKKFSLPQTVRMAYKIDKPKIIVAINIDEPDPIPSALIRAFQDLELLILGYKTVPEQTSPEQSREEFGEEAEEKLKKIVSDIEDREVTVKSELTFTPNKSETIHQYAEEQKCHAVLHSKSIESIERILVPVYSEDQITRRWATVIKNLSQSSDLPISLIILTSLESASEEERDIDRLQNISIRELEIAGLSVEDIRHNKVDVDSIADAVGQLSDEGDLIVLGESKPTERESFFQTLHKEIEEASSNPRLAILQESQ